MIMKRAFIASALIIAQMALCNATAQTLKVLGTTVSTTTDAIATTAEGCSITGNVSYDAASKTLTLDNAVLTARLEGGTWKTDAKENIIESTIDGLTIRVVGESKLRVGANTTNHALKLGANTTITGPGRLTLTDARYDSEGAAQTVINPNGVMLTSDVTLTLRDVSVESYLPWSATGRDRNGWNSRGQLVVTGSNLEFPLNSLEANHANIGYFTTVTLDADAYVYPEGLQFNYQTTSWGETVTRCLASIDGTSIYQGPIQILKETPAEPLPDYTLYVAGQRVKKDGAIEGDGITGSIAYDEATSTLTLTDATISTTGNTFGVQSEVKNLTILLVGNNTITIDDGDKGATLKLTAGTQTTITSTTGGSLALKRTSPTAKQKIIDQTDASLTISNCTLDADNHFYGGYREASQLIIDNANVSLAGYKADDDGGTITGFGMVSVTNATIVTPANAYFNAENYYGLVVGDVEDEDNVDWYTGAFQTQADNLTTDTPTEVYLKVAGCEVVNGQVTTQSADNQIYGSVYFDAATHTLTLDEANISTITNGIETDRDLTIVLKGDNTIVVDDTAAGTYALLFTGDNNVTLTSPDGTGTLTIINFTQEFDGTGNAWDAGFQALKLSQDATLTIKDCAVTSYESWMPSHSGSRKYGHLVVDNATLDLPLYIEDEDWPTFGFFKSLTLKDCHFTKPADGIYDPTDGFIHSDAYAAETDGYYWEAVRIAPEGGDGPGAKGYLKIAGVKVSKSTDNIEPTADGSEVTGTVSYDAETATLTLQDATIKCYIDGEYENNNMEDCLYSEVNGLTINLIGKNTIYYGWGRGMVFAKDATIQSADGTGELYVTTFSGNTNYPEGLYVDATTTLSVKRASVKFDMPVDLTGEDDESVGGTLVIDDANLAITPEAAFGRKGYLRDVTDLKLTDAVIKDPENRGIHFDASKHAIVYGDFGNAYKGAIIIESTNQTTGINATQSNLADEVIYDLQGRRVVAPTKGVFVSSGKKIVLK